MTLPQHLEPFLFRDNPSLTCALRAIDQEYHTAGDAEGALAHVFLKVIARGTCQGFCDRILSIYELSQPASRQLAHDISMSGLLVEKSAAIGIFRRILGERSAGFGNFVK
jgi:hypothetical protein